MATQKASDTDTKSPALSASVATEPKPASSEPELADLDRSGDLYDELHAIASRHMSSEPMGGLLQTTAIVHEAYLKLASQRQTRWADKQSFFAAAAATMRRLLIDNARKEKSAKRGGQFKRGVLLDSRLSINDQGFSAVVVHDALEQLAEFAPEEAEALELMIYAGMTGEEIAKRLGLSPSTIDRKVRAAKAWLKRTLSDG